MRIRIILAAFAAVVLGSTLTSCFKSLDLEPYNGFTNIEVYKDPANYINVLAKIYAGMSTTGNQGPAGQGDLGGFDEGFSGYLRVWWNLQEVTTDAAYLRWNDPGVEEIVNMNINALNPWSRGAYYRMFFQIALCNEFMQNTTDAKLSERGFSQADKDMISGMRSEARMIRALVYSHAIDLFGNPPFVDDVSTPPPGSFFKPNQIARPALFEWLETELLALEGALSAPRWEYARVDQATAWMTLAKLYLNAEVYNGQPRYSDCLTYVNKVINAGYQLDDQYRYLFLADNNLSTEIIHAVTHDGAKTQSYSGTVYLVHAPMIDAMEADSFGVNSGWNGLAATPEFLDIFTDTVNDKRYMFWSAGQDRDVTERTENTQGYPATKWKNVDRSGNTSGSNPAGDFVDNDYPLYRLGDAYLMYAECVVRGGGGDVNTAVGYINELRERAYGDASGNISAGELDLDFVLDERARELYWEGYRRQDLIRFGLFLGSGYVWTFKGGPVDGTALPSGRDLFPLPASDLTVNDNLIQNPGY